MHKQTSFLRALHLANVNFGVEESAFQHHEYSLVFALVILAAILFQLGDDFLRVSFHTSPILALLAFACNDQRAVDTLFDARLANNIEYRRSLAVNAERQYLHFPSFVIR